MNESVLDAENIESGSVMLKIRKKLYFFFKRFIDIIAGLLGIILLVPMTIIIKLISIY